MRNHHGGAVSKVRKVHVSAGTLLTELTVLDRTPTERIAYLLLQIAFRFPWPILLSKVGNHV